MEPVALVRLALSVLTERSIVLLSLAMACFLTGWVMYAPSWERVVALVIFAAFGYLAVLHKERKHDVHDSQG